MRYRPSFEEFRRVDPLVGWSDWPGAGLSPAYRRHADAGQAFCKIQEGDWSFLFESVIGGERLGRYSFVGCRSLPAFPGVWTARADSRSATRLPRGRHPDRVGTRRSLRLLEERLAGLSLRRFCRGCRVSAEEPSVMRPTTRFATSSVCRIRRRTIAVCPISASPSTIAWSSSITSTRPIAVVAHAHVDPAEPAFVLRRRLRARRSSRRTAAPGRRRPATDGHRTARRRDGQLPLELRAAAFEAAVDAARNTSMPATFSRWSSASACKRRRVRGPLIFTGRLRVVNPSPFLFYLKSGPLCLVGSSPEIMVARGGRQGDDSPAGRHAAARPHRRGR